MMDRIKSGVSALLPSLDTILSPRQLIQLPFILNPLSIPSEQSTSSIKAQQSCPNPSLSCSSGIPSPIDTCCLNYPSGHFLLAQFWDNSPSLGPLDSWTLHGLWPDYCTGGYPANCDRGRDLSGPMIAGIVDDASKTTHPSLRKYMDKFWKGLHTDEDLWSHEWNKHGTCVSTLEPSCYDSYSSSTHTNPASTHDDLLDYLSAATNLHSTLKTYDILAAHNITPSHTQTYNLVDIQSALASSHRTYIATVKCKSNHVLNEIWIHFTTRGSLRNITSDTNMDDLFVPVPPDGLITTCPATGIKYLPKWVDQYPTPYPPPPPNGQPFEGRGHLKVHVLSNNNNNEDVSLSSDLQTHSEGCLIRQGYWYTSGTCATYHTKRDVSHVGKDADPEDLLFTLSSSYAPCAVLEFGDKHGVEGQFVCANRLPVQSIFGVGKSSGGKEEVLSWKGQTVFFADNTPGRFEKVKIFGNDGNGTRKVRLEIRWESS